MGVTVDSACSTDVPILKFVVFPFSRYESYDTVSVSAVLAWWRRMTAILVFVLRLWPWNCCALLRVECATATNFGASIDVPFSTYRPTPIRRVTWPCDIDIWPWRSLRLSLMRVFALRLYTNFEVRMRCLPVRKILGINRPGDLELWHFDL